MVHEDSSSGSSNPVHGSCSNSSTSSLIKYECLDNNMVHKQFLEQICDECLLEEFVNQLTPTSVLSNECISGESREEILILDSEVTIEIDTCSVHDLSTSVHDPMIEADKSRHWESNSDEEEGSSKHCIQSPIRDSLLSVAYQKYPSQGFVRWSIDSATTTNDADDEGFLYLQPSSSSAFLSSEDSPPRSVCSTENVPHRTGFDLGREEIQLELRSLQTFNDIGVDQDSFDSNMMNRGRSISREDSWAGKDPKHAWSKVKSVKNIISSLKTNLTRSKSSIDITIPAHEEDDESTKPSQTQHAIDGNRVVEKRLPAMTSFMTVRAVVEEEQQTKYKVPDLADHGHSRDGVNNTTNQSEYDYIAKELEDDETSTNWEKHLQHDMKRRLKHRAHQKIQLSEPVEEEASGQRDPLLMQCSPVIASKPKSQSATNNPMTLGTNVEISRSISEASTNLKDVSQVLNPDIYSRLPSPASMLLPNRSMVESSSWPLLAQTGERLDEVLGPGEFDRNKDENQWIWEDVPRSTVPSRRLTHTSCGRDSISSDVSTLPHMLSSQNVICDPAHLPFMSPVSFSGSNQRESSNASRSEHIPSSLHNQSSGIFVPNNEDEGNVSIHPLATGLVHGLSIKKAVNEGLGFEDEDLPRVFNRTY